MDHTTPHKHHLHTQWPDHYDEGDDNDDDDDDDDEWMDGVMMIVA